jgi:hypothetical protein
MESVVAEVLPVGNNAGEPLPTLAHNGIKHVIAEPGTEWELRVKILNAKENQRYRVSQQHQQHCCPACWPHVLCRSTAAKGCWMPEARSNTKAVQRMCDTLPGMQHLSVGDQRAPSAADAKHAIPA